MLFNFILWSAFYFHLQIIYLRISFIFLLKSSNYAKPSSKVTSAFLYNTKRTDQISSLDPITTVFLFMVSTLKLRNKLWYLLSLRLWGRYFFHVHPGPWFPACGSISRFQTSTAADPEAHAHSTFVDFLTDSFNVTYAVQSLKFAASSIDHVDYTINGCWNRTLCSVKGEIPSTAAVVTVCDAEIAIPEDTYPCVVGHLLENTFLCKRMRRSA